MQVEPKNQKTLTREQIRIYLKDLSHYSKTMREQAQRQLLLHAADTIDILLEEYEKEFREYSQKQLLLRNRGKAGVKLGLILLFTPFYLLFKDDYGVFFLAWYFMIACILGYSFLLPTYASKTPARLSEIYQVLTGVSDPRIFSTILEMYSVSSNWYLENTLDLLKGYLPQVTPSQWGELSIAQRKALYSLVESQGQINTKRCYEFTLAALKALEQFGDEKAIPCVEYVARYSINKRVKSAAQDCLRYLEVRRDEDSIRQTLLRASQSEGGKDELLRVPTQTPATESEQLLRMPREEG